MEITDYYTYAYLDENKKPYYIGKGRNARALIKHENVKMPNKDNILILKKNLTEKNALKHEQYMIFVYGRKINCSGILENKLIQGGQSLTKGYMLYNKEDPDEWSDSILCSIFGNKTAACVLLFIQQNNEAHANRIANTFGFGLNMVQRQLKRLEQNYILNSRVMGNVRLYSFNTRNPTINNLKTFLNSCLINK